MKHGLFFVLATVFSLSIGQAKDVSAQEIAFINDIPKSAGVKLGLENGEPYLWLRFDTDSTEKITEQLGQPLGAAVFVMPLEGNEYAKDFFLKALFERQRVIAQVKGKTDFAVKNVNMIAFEILPQPISVEMD